MYLSDSAANVYGCTAPLCPKRIQGFKSRPREYNYLPFSGIYETSQILSDSPSANTVLSH